MPTQNKVKARVKTWFASTHRIVVPLAALCLLSGLLYAQDKPAQPPARTAIFAITNISPNSWSDDSAWMNAKATFTEPSDEKTAAQAVSINVQAQAQVFYKLPFPLKKDKVYLIEVDFKTIGQIESQSFYFRDIALPWKSYGGMNFSGIRVDRKIERAQLRTDSDAVPGQIGLFCNASGSGSILVYGVTISEMDEFDFSIVPVSPAKGSVMTNPEFIVQDMAWYVQGSGTNKPAIGGGRVSGPQGSVGYHGILPLNYGVPYTLEMRGTPNTKVSFGLNRFWSQDGHFNGIALFDANGMFKTNVSLNFPRYGSLSASSAYFLFSFSAPALSNAVTKAALYAGAESTEPECAFRFPDEIRAVCHYIELGKSFLLRFGTYSIPEGAQAAVEMRDHRERLIERFPVTITKQANGLPGGSCKVKATHSGFMIFRLVYQDKPARGIPGELTVTDNRPAACDESDFVLGTHLQFVESRGQTNDTVIFRKPGDFLMYEGTDEYLKGVRRWGLRSERLHSSEIRWWSVERAQGNFLFWDAMFDKAIEHGIEQFGMLDGTAYWASTAPESERKKGWPDGPGSFPPKDFKDWQNYVARMVVHHKKRIQWWEIWNEPDHIFLQLAPNGPFKTREEAYMQLLKTAYAAAKKADPNCKIVAGATTAGGKRFLLTCIEMGMLDVCDGISFHGYGRDGMVPQKGAKAFEDIVVAMQDAMRAHGFGTKEKPFLPIIDSEASAGSGQGGIHGVKPAEFAVKGVLARRAAGLARFYFYSDYYWYSPANTGMSCFRSFESRPVPAQGLMAAYDRRLGNTRFLKNLGDDSAGTHVYAFYNPKSKEPVIAGWYSGGTNACPFKQDLIVSGRVYDSGGNPAGKFSEGAIELTDEIRYFTAK